jgi:hypothetical protein
MASTKVIQAHSAVTATATSAPIPTVGAKKVTIELIENATVLNRSGVLTITGALARGGTHRAINMLTDNVANTNGQQLTRVVSKTRATAGVDLLFLDLSQMGFAEIKAVLTITDGATPSGTFDVNIMVEKC